MVNEIRTIVQSMSDFGDTEIDAAAITALIELKVNHGTVITEADSNTTDYIAAKVVLNILVNKRNVRNAKINNQIYVPFPIVTAEIKTLIQQKDETASIITLSTPPDTSSNHWSTKVT